MQQFCQYIHLDITNKSVRPFLFTISNVICLINPQNGSWVLFTIVSRNSLYRGLSVLAWVLYCNGYKVNIYNFCKPLSFLTSVLIVLRNGKLYSNLFFFRKKKNVIALFFLHRVKKNIILIVMDQKEQIKGKIFNIHSLFRN